MALQTDGALLAAGTFTLLDGQGRNYIGRLINTDPANQQLSYDGSALLWSHQGSGCEFWRTTFEASTNGVDWTYLGSGSYVSGGWRLNSSSLPLTSVVRARGFISGGSMQTSGWFAERSLTLATQSPAMLLQQTFSELYSNNFGFMVQGIPGQIVIIEASTDLKTWVPVETNTIEGGGLIWEDSSWTNWSQRFYRVRLR